MLSLRFRDTQVILNLLHGGMLDFNHQTPDVATPSSTRIVATPTPAKAVPAPRAAGRSAGARAHLDLTEHHRRELENPILAQIVRVEERDYLPPGVVACILIAELERLWIGTLVLPWVVVP
ncbi:hypothetical protein R3P38DRAFT_2760210 [Favolaschia claudopus]|uniref:Uncharacterized protein n=1 Tax=Favolaschia claudopus TaxID=2862362 RepID=A0AAW0E1T3_9AGAR